MSCAARQDLPPGDELEHPETSSVPPSESPLHSPTMPHVDQDLQRSFENPNAPAPKPAPAPVAATPTAAPAEPEVAPEPTATQARENERKDTLAKLQEIRRAVQRKKWEFCELVDTIPVANEWPVELQLSRELSVACSLGQGQASVAKALAWLKACGPDKVDGCRAKAIAALSAAGRVKGADKAGVEAKVKELREADTCLKGAEASKATPPCLETAITTYRKYGDELMKARLWLSRARALEAKKHPDPLTLYGKAENECHEVRCSQVRRKALLAVARLALGQGDAELAATSALREGALAAAALPEGERHFGRSLEADRSCAALDKKDGPGTCRKLEKKLTGDWRFRDYSKAKAKRGLSGELVKEVNEHFAVLLQECLSVEALRLTPPNSETYEVRWMVLNDGKVGEVHLGRKEQEETDLARCLRKQFTTWRYPRYDGEAQHVEQRFTVSAHQRR